jgi:hypothetical protein
MLTFYPREQIARRVRMCAAARFSFYEVLLIRRDIFLANQAHGGKYGKRDYTQI